MRGFSPALELHRIPVTGVGNLIADLNKMRKNPYVLLSGAKGHTVRNRGNNRQERANSGSTIDSDPLDESKDHSGFRTGQNDSSKKLFVQAYDDLRYIAHNLFAREKPGHTLQPTALVNEVYLKLAEQSRARWKSRTHFLSVGAHAMRRLLVDHARKRDAAKRGSSPARLDLLDLLDAPLEAELDIEQVLYVNDALEKLAQFDDRQALIVTLRFFGGLTVDEVADAVGVSPRTAALDWRHAKAWLHIEISGGSH